MNANRIDASPRALVRLSWPIFIELLLQLLVGNMDQIQLSHFNGTAVAAVGNANTVFNVVLLTFNVICLAATIMVSQYRGAGDLRRTNQIYTLSLAVNGLAGLALAAGLILFAGPLYRLMQVPAELVAEAKAYLVITAAALPLQALMLTFSAFLRAGAHMKVIMCITALVNVCNIAGNWVLINGVGPFPRLGAAGAALSSSIFRVMGTALMAWAFFRSEPGAKIGPAQLRPFPKDLLRRLLAIGLPSAGEGLSYNLSQASCLVFVNLMGTYVVTTRMYAAMFANCVYMLVSAVSQAGGIVIGYQVGARDLDGADGCCRRILKIFCPVTVGLAVCIWLLSRPLFGLFSTDPQVIALGAQVMAVEIALELGRSFNIVLVRALQSVGDVKYPVAVGICSQWAVAVGLGYLLGMKLGWGLVGLWAAFACDECLRAAVFLLRWKSGRWRTMKTV